MKTTIITALLAICLIAIPVKAETWMDAYIDSIMEAIHAPGLSAKIIQNGGIIWSGDYGCANYEFARMVQDTTVFGTGSTSKSCAAIALMQLWEDSLFHLDDDINDYLPFTVSHPQYPGSTITFRMLMTHTSSILDNWDVMVAVMSWGGDSPIPLGQFLEDYLVPGGAYYYPSHYWSGVPPGTYWEYTNVGACLAGYLVEAITGVDYDEYCRENIFIPLGMDETSHFFAYLDTNNVAMPYHWNGWANVPWGFYSAPWYPSSTMKTSTLQLSDYLTAIMQYGQYGGERILDSTTVVEMLTPQIAFGDTGNQGLLWLNYLTPTLGLWIWGHHGGWLGVASSMWFCPDINSGLVVLCNQDVDQVGDSFYFDIPLELWNFAISYDPVNCTLMPQNPPIIIPPGGGSFDFTIDIENQSDSIAVFDVWIDVTLPSGEMYGPIVLREDINMPAYGSISRQLSQAVPGGAPPGEYSYNAYVGEYPQYAWNEGTFNFTKDSQVGVGMDLSDWYFEGWDEGDGPYQAVRPLSLTLYSPNPNPFNPVTVLGYELPAASQVKLSVYDVAGRQVAELVDGWRDAGYHESSFNAGGLASGIYIYRMQAADYMAMGKMVLIK